MRQIVSEVLDGLQAGQQIEVWADVINDHFPQVTIDMPEFAALFGYLAELVGRTAAQPATGSGVIDGLVHPEPGQDPLSPLEATMHVLQIILAGTDATGSLFTNLATSGVP